MLRKPRTDIRFRDTEYQREIFKNKRGDQIIIDQLVHFSSNQRIQFINTPLGMTVISTYGNLVFNVPLVPTAISYVDDNYWLRMLQTNSHQDVYEYDAGATKSALTTMLREHVLDEDLDEEAETPMLEYLNHILYHADDERSYLSLTNEIQAIPDDMEHPDIPLCYKVKPNILLLFDAFEYICEQIKMAE